MKQNREITTKNFSRDVIFTKAMTTQEDLQKFIIRGVFSTVHEDRHGEVVDQNGWNLKEYLLNPVVLYNHDHSIPAIAKMVELYVGPNGLEGAMQFAAEESDFAREIFGLYAGGFMNAFSCGFLNDVYEYDQVNDKIILRENSLLEVSCVNVPANALALAKSLGMNMKAVEKACPCENKEVVEPCPEDCECDACVKIREEEARANEVIPEAEATEAEESVKSVLESITKAGSVSKAVTRRDMVLMVNKSIGELLKVKKIIR